MPLSTVDGSHLAGHRPRRGPKRHHEPPLPRASGRTGASSSSIERSPASSRTPSMIVCLICGVNSVVVPRCFQRKRAGLGGADKIVEVDETYVGGKAKNQVKRETAPKEAVLSLAERGGRAASFHVANITAEKVRPLIVANANRASVLNSDEGARPSRSPGGIRKGTARPGRRPTADSVQSEGLMSDPF